jgi:uncharacterized integral membrane protein
MPTAEGRHAEDRADQRARGRTEPLRQRDEAPAGHEQPAAGREPTPLSQVVGRIVLGIVAVLFVIFSLFNLQRVDFSWIFGSTQVITRGGEYVGGGVPLIVLLLGSFALGASVGAGFVWRRERIKRARWERRRARR